MGRRTPVRRFPFGLGATTLQHHANAEERHAGDARLRDGGRRRNGRDPAATGGESAIRALAVGEGRRRVIRVSGRIERSGVGEGLRFGASDFDKLHADNVVSGVEGDLLVPDDVGGNDVVRPCAWDGNELESHRFYMARTVDDVATCANLVRLCRKGRTHFFLTFVLYFGIFSRRTKHDTTIYT